MKTTKILSLVAFLLCFTLNLRAQSGTCGANLTWELVNDTLIITGSGAMDNSRPWSSYSSQIVHVSISEGVTNICDNAFEFHRNLLSVIIPNTVTSVGQRAFYECTSLTQITMSNAVETIGSNAFYKTAITSITLPSTLISLGEYAFYECKQLTEITIPGNLSSIAAKTFYNCTSLRKLVIEEGVTTIGANAFEGCSKLNDITIPEGVTSIDIHAFQGCSRITEISLPSSLINLGGSVFYGCSSLASIVIPDKITSIENHTFYGCTSLKEVTLPQTILKIEEYAFRDCAFTQFTIPSSATEIQAYAFSYCKNLTSITLPSGMTKIPNNLFDHCSSLTSIVIPEGVTAIETGAFWECTSLTSVTIPEGVTSIYGEAFYNCSLTTLTLPNSLEEIGNSAYCNSCGGDYLGAFAHNTNLTSVVIPKNVSRIGSDAFEGCTSLSQITLQEGLKEIGANAFLDCGALRSIIIPEGVTTIGEDAFANCRLTEISLPRSLKTIGDNGVFQGNKFLTSVTIYGGVERIGSYAFDGCTSLSQVTLHEGITTIGEFAFQNCSSLRSITLPEGVTTIEGGAFYNCDLRDISLPQSLTIVNDAIRLLTNGPWYGAFANNPNLTTFVSPDNVTFIGSYTFSGCHSLKNIVLNDNLLTLGTGIFNDCFAMESITFPKNITAIPATAFHECYALSEVNLPEGLISIGESAFAYCSSLKTVQLPKTVTSLYRSFATSGVVEMDIPEGVAVLESTFDGCSKLKKVTLPSTLTTLGAYTFKNCTSLPTITLPQGLLTIGSYVFSGCTALDSITLPSQLTSIGEEAFMSCSALRNITIPNSVKSIGNKAFASCTALREITIPNQVSSISSELFSGCTALSSVTLPNSITKINSSAFYNCTALQEITLPEGLTAIGSSAFYNCSALRSLTIPSTVVDLTGSAIFNACKSLSNLNLLPLTPPSIKNSNSGSQYQPLYGTPSTMKINLVCGAKEAYMADANWAKLTYPINEIFSNILTIKSNDNRMGEAYIPMPNTCDNDTAIIEALPREGYQFAAWHDGNTDNPRTILVTQDTTFTANFEPLTTYQLTVNYDPKQGHISGIGEYYPNEEATLTVTPLGGYRFSKWGDGNTDNPRTIIMTQDTTLEALFIMGDYCGDDILYTFLNDTLALNGTGDMWNLSQYGWNMYADEVSALTLSNGITSIGTNAFMNLMFLPEVIIPASVKTIHKRAFENCRSLSSVTFAENSQLQTIDHWAFYECINLKALEIPEGVTTIGNGAFYGCAYLDSIVLPASMMSIADNGFAQCTKLSAMTVHAITPPAVDSKTFESVNRAIPVYVPFGTGATYRATPIWQEFDIREMEAEIGSSCEAPIEVELDYTDRIEGASEVWYQLWTYDLPVKIHFTPDADNSSWGPEIQIDYTCSPGFYDDPKIEAMMNELSEFGMAMPIELIFDPIINDGKTEWTTSINQSYREQLQQYGITYNVGMYIKITYFEAGEISFTQECENVYPEFDAKFCGSFTWNGVEYTEPGDYIQTYTKADGCDSIVTLHLIEDCPCEDIFVDFEVTACDFYDWNGQTYTQSGEYTYTTVAANGCDSIVTLHLTISPTLTAEETITACDFYEWNGQTYTQSGEYTYSTIAANGCDSIVTLHLTISPTLTAEETITACDFYDWNGQTYTQSGDYTYTTVAANGCDSIVTLHLTINQSEVDTTEYATICYGETYTWNGQDYTTEGAYTMTFSTSNGCDSTVTLHLTVLPEAVMIEESVTLNEEQLPYIWRGQSCDHAGVYTISEPFANYPYCDSVIYVLNLIVEAPNKCGDHLYWHYSNNTMTITGYGAMYDDPDILSYRTQDWYPVRVNNIVLPDAITHIGNVAFADCANLTSIVIPNRVTSIGDGAFSWTGLQAITIPASVTELGEQVFETCNDLRTILYEGNPIAINNQTVHPLIGCVHLDTIIAHAALWHCTTADPALEARYGVPHKARYIEVTDGELTNQAIKYIANNSGAMEILDLTNATNTTLPYGAWSNSYQLSTLYLPQQIEVIPESMVEGARNLSEIAIPATVTEIGNYAFAGCVNVWRMTVEAVIPPKVYENTFDGISRSISVQVPAGSEDLYREAAYWREFFIEHTNTPSPISNCQKLLREDQILILRNGKVYTTMGQLITNE